MRNARLLLPFLLLATLACSTNPVTGKREFNIVSESQEIAMGQESHQQVIREFGVYDEKPEVSRMVERIGRELAARSDRPNLPWTFTVLDSPMVNAMALPGGYIYVTRGMLERINSEDEVAGVLGHEIAHVTARHAAQRISRAQVAQLGMVLGAVIAGPEATQAYGQLAELGIGLLFQRYSRAQETQADLIGTGYMAEAQYNPVGAERMLQALQRLDKDPAAGIERYFLSHPDPAKRVKDVRGKIAELGGAGSSQPPDRERYVRLLDGAITGASTENLVIRGDTIYDRAHGLILQVPPGWTATTAPGVVFAMSPRGRNQQAQLMMQEVDTRELQGMNAQDAVRRRLQEMGLQFAGTREGVATRSGQRMPVDVWTGQTQGGPVGVETTQFLHGDHVAVFLFLTPSLRRDQSPLGDVLSRAVIDPARARAAEPARMRIGIVRAGESWEDLARRATGNPRDAEVIANINGFDGGTRPQAGMMVKLPQEVISE